MSIQLAQTGRRYGTKVGKQPHDRQAQRLHRAWNFLHVHVCDLLYQMKNAKVYNIINDNTIIMQLNLFKYTCMIVEGVTKVDA